MARNRYDVDESLEAPFDITHFKRSFKYVKKHLKRMAFVLFLTMISIVLSLMTPKISAYMLDDCIPNKKVKLLVILGICLMVFTIINILFTKVRSRIMAKVSQEIVYDIRTDVFEHLQRLPFSYYDDRPQGKILVRVVEYVNSVSNMLSNGIISMITQVFSLIFIVIFMFTANVTMSLVIILGLPVLIVVFFTLKPAQRRAWQQSSNKNSNLNAYLQESINGMRVTQIFTREDENLEIFSKLSTMRCRAWKRAVLLSHLTWFFVDNIGQFFTSALYVVGLLLVAPTSSVGVGLLMEMANYSSRFWQPINALATLYADILNVVAYLERIFQTLDEPVVIGNAPDAVELPEIKGAVEFKNVVFGYEPGKIVLNNVNFTVEPVQSIALVGPTGAGKSTVVNLISRFYDVNSGQVLIDGYDVSKVTLHSLRSQMGIMLQDSFIFSGTIADNVRYGRLDATMEEIAAACKVVHADEFINEMSEKFYTEVKERGGRLSQGQKQLLSFARTIISDPKILILDEATSAIDTKTEQYVQEGINHLLKGRTSFIIAHRLSTIKSCDKIMYIANQNIMECGSHEELMAKKGEYYKLYTSQLSE